MMSTTAAEAAVATTTTAAAQQQQSFEPVLNVPAFSVFLLVAVLFAALQWRLSAIGSAAEERTAALDRLRHVKAEQLSSPSNDDDGDGGVQEALRAYEAAAYWKAEGPPHGDSRRGAARVATLTVHRSTSHGGK